jgi:hypothetical protein
MIIAMPIMRVMQMSVHQIIDMITMRNCLMSASESMDMALIMAATRVLSGTRVRIGGAYRNDVLINMALMRMMQVSIMQVVDVAFMHYRPMSAMRAMFMRMVFVNIAGSHTLPPLVGKIRNPIQFDVLSITVSAWAKTLSTWLFYPPLEKVKLNQMLENGV